MRDGLQKIVLALTLSGLCGAAQATPAFVNPTFSSTSTTTSFAYSQPITGWTDVSGAGSATGIAAQVPADLWDNGIAPNAASNVTFLQNETSGLTQTVGGFVSGHQYQITVVADARAATGPAGLSISVNTVEFGNFSLIPTPVGAVDLYGVYATPWGSYKSAVFTSSGVSNLIELQNLGIPNSSTFDDVTIDLGNVSIADVTPTGVPEPTSIALLAIMLGGIIAIRQWPTPNKRASGRPLDEASVGSSPV